jgi:predicted RNA binding protein YcfA (HicA-like mRNA interferase family)
MKRGLLIKIISNGGAVLLRHGRKHDVYENPQTGAREQVPRHTDIKENLAKSIIKNLA